MTQRYYVPELPSAGGLVQLPKAEALHALRVMRIAVGDRITLFDGCGNESTATITTTARNECTCTATGAVPINRELERKIHLAIALPKIDRAKEMIERLTEIGVAKVTPLVAQRTQRQPSESSVNKLQRSIIEACKQSGRNQLMELAPVTSFQQFFSGDLAPRRWIADPSGQPQWQHIAEQAGDEVVAVVGPEGGFTDLELELATSHGFSIMGLGRRIYRVETAAVVVAAVLATGAP